ncbi:heat shock factor protein 2 [Xenopus laevis]|uniref:Heat shock factor protein 2 n=1 Tax=Xenopus laevis TaxID=8355 RepID=A0A8J0VC22_XENLA|nr:heat shock factor protein 2 [Xenopus laevis]
MSSKGSGDRGRAICVCVWFSVSVYHVNGLRQQAASPGHQLRTIYWNTSRMRPSSSVPKFLTKIWSLVEDPINTDYITWSQDGNSFIVVDEESFAKDILPKHFKHSNMASFVRQLNWYGFHKVVNEEPGVVKQEKYCSGRYQHAFFKQGHEDLLSKIKRKVPVPRIEEGKNVPDDNHKILAFLHQLQGRQDVIESTVESLKRENKSLWKEVLELRQKQFPNPSDYETVAPSQSYDRMPSHEPLMIDNTGNYNQLSVPKSPQNTEQVFENTPTWSVNGDVTRGTKRTYSMREEPLESSAEESSSQLMSVTIPEMYESYQAADSDHKPDTSSSESEEIANEDTAPELSPVLPGRIKTFHKNKKTKRIQRRNRDCDEYGAVYSYGCSGSEDAEETKPTFADSGYSKKCHKSCKASFIKINDGLRRMHEENTMLTKRMINYENQSVQKLSEISTVLSTLANFIMNSGNAQKSIPPVSLTADMSETQYVSRGSQCHRSGMWSATADNTRAKKQLHPKIEDTDM